MILWVVETFEKEEWIPVPVYWEGLQGIWRIRKNAEYAMKEIESQQPTKYYDVKYRVAEYIRRD